MKAAVIAFMVDSPKLLACSVITVAEIYAGMRPKERSATVALLDSLETYELVYAIEEELGISIPDEKANEFETVRDALEYIQSQLEKK